MTTPALRQQSLDYCTARALAERAPKDYREAYLDVANRIYAQVAETIKRKEK